MEKIELARISMLGKSFSDSTILMHEAIANSIGLTGADHKYLSHLIQNGPMTAGDLARLTGLTTGAVTGVIDRLTKMGLVKRDFDDFDRRKIMIVPDMHKAQALLGPISADLQKRIVEVVAGFKDSEIVVIEKYLQTTIAVMDNFTSDLKVNKLNSSKK